MSEVKFLERNLCEVDGYKFYLHPLGGVLTTTKSVSKHIREGKRWEAPVLDILIKYSNKTKLFVDVGASIGVHTIPLADKNKAVVAFEPDQAAFELLEKSVALNGKENIDTIRKGLGSKKGVAHMGPACTINRGITDTKNCNIEIVRGDNELKELGFSLSTVGLIKIDAESYEDEVLLGLTETIEKAKPFIWMETHDDPIFPYGSRKKALDFMRQKNYELMVQGEKDYGKFNGLWRSTEK